jgi:hypothetical protein
MVALNTPLRTSFISSGHVVLTFNPVFHISNPTPSHFLVFLADQEVFQDLFQTEEILKEVKTEDETLPY